jgi:DNA-binding NarL/FixJ family response regulator
VKQTNKKIRLAIVGMHRLIRELFCIAVDNEKLIDVVAEANNLRQAIDVAREHKPDVILLNLVLPVIDIDEILADIRKAYPDTKVLIVSSDLNEDDLQSMIRAGARGYISKRHTSKADLLHAIKAVHRGEFWIERKMTAKLLEEKFNNNSKTDDHGQNPKKLLTAREREVIGYLAKGCSNKEIASALFISDKTVKCHINNIFKKLNVSRRIEALLFAIKNGLELPNECEK